MTSIPLPEPETEFVNGTPGEASKAGSSRKSASTGSSTSSRKRPKPSDNGEEEEEKKRSRGRPRLDANDETAADRRRTQIRLAQRAYRQRKDTAIVSLEQKVKDLEEANEAMGKEFMNFYDFFLAQGMINGAPAVAQRLSETTRKFLSLAHKTAGESSRDNGDLPVASAPAPAPAAAPAPASSTPASAPAPTPAITHELGPTQRRPSKQSTTTSTSNSYSEGSVQATSSGPPGLSSVGASPPSPRIFNTVPQQSYEIITHPTIENASFPMFDTQAQFPFFDNSFASPFCTLPAPTSYAFQERSFSRRLQRSVLEAGLRLVSMQSPPPHRYAAVFGFCLLFESREAIINRLTVGLNRTRDETLSIWKYPFTNLGGAGFFFPDQSANGNMMNNGNAIEVPDKAQGLRELFKPDELTGFSMGPFGPEVEAARDERVDHRMRMMYQGFEGDFYDANEVDVYLQQRGILIAGSADFVEAEIDTASFQDASSTASSNDTRNPLEKTPIPTSGPGYHGVSGTGVDLMGNMWPQTNLSPMAIPSMMDTPAMALPAMNISEPPRFGTGMVTFGDPMRGWTSGAGPRWTKTRVTVDVARLLRELIGAAVCLGRTPGLRPKDINKAVRIAAGLSENP